MSVFGSELWKSYGDVKVVLKVHGLHRVERHICEHDQILAQSVHAVHCCKTLAQCHIHSVYVITVITI